MTDLRRCASMMTLGFATPREVAFYVNGLFRECDVHDPRVQTTAQFWCSVYARYCVNHYRLNIGTEIRLMVRWDDAVTSLPIECHPQTPYDEPMDSREFFRLLSRISPDSVRTDIPVDWEFLSPSLEFGTDTDTQTAEKPTYEELL